MFDDRQLYEAALRKTKINILNNEHDCCEFVSGIEAITCEKNWYGNHMPREFIEMSEVFRNHSM